jgi:hypothetical protein
MVVKIRIWIQNRIPSNKIMGSGCQLLTDPSNPDSQHGKAVGYPRIYEMHD